MTKRRTLASFGVALAAFVLLRGAEPEALRQERLWRHRHLGKAFFENPATQQKAVAEFSEAVRLAPESFRDRLNLGLALLRAGRPQEAAVELQKAQERDPKVPHTWFNLGLAYKRLGRVEDAVAQFERLVQLAPADPAAHYNLGALYVLAERAGPAMAHFEKAHAAAPRMVAPLFRIYNLHRLAGRDDDARKALARFEEAKAAQKQFDETEDPEWSDLCEIYDPIAPAAIPPLPDPVFEDRVLWKTAPANAGLAVTDTDGDGRPDLLAWAGGRLRNVPQWKDVRSVAPGDFDNDGLADLCIVTGAGAALARNTRGGYRIEAAGVARGDFARCLWLDFDHDYDLDLLLLGAHQRLLRNEGAAGFRDRTGLFPFVPDHALDAVAVRVVPDGPGRDLVVSYAGRAAVLYRDQLRGQFRPESLPAVPPRAASLTATDADTDGWMDLAFRSGDAVHIAPNRRGVFPSAERVAAGAPVFADLANRGVADLIAGDTVYEAPRFQRRTAALPHGIAWAAADFDRDGRIDLAAWTAAGELRMFRNATPAQRSLRVAITGVKNLKLLPGADVEVRASGGYRKQVYDGVPLLFGLGAAQRADTVRILWPNGLMQNEPVPGGGSEFSIREAPKLSGSCPMVFTWNGSRFKLLSDVLGVAPLGASSSEHGYFPVDHDEVLQIAPADLVPRGGRYDIRITEELHEVTYLDQVRLIAVDHAEAAEIFTNDKFQSPPFQPLRLYGVNRRIYPRAARDHRGRDVLPRLLRRDRACVDGFTRDFKGVAEPHSLELDFGAAARDNRAVLVLNGWVDWADGSTFSAMSQQGNGGLRFPSLQVKDTQGRWKTVLPDMGLPSGLPKTIAVDLTGLFQGPSRQVRICTNLCLYWDEIFLGEDSAAPAVRWTALAPALAGLDFRGFSRPILDPRRLQPDCFDYAHVLPYTNWNQTPGLYTRLGDVRELLDAVDDRFVIMGSGDEVRLSFDAAAFPPVPAGFRRSFLFLVDGWSKDADANTGHSQSVEPLPFHGMSGYPYPPGERFPDGPWRQKYNTRKALRLVPE